MNSSVNNPVQKSRATAEELAVIDRARRGERITILDKLDTCATPEEVDGFEEGLRITGRLTPELVVALLRRRKEIEAQTRKRSRP